MTRLELWPDLYWQDGMWLQISSNQCRRLAA